MSYLTADARQQLLDDLAVAIEALARSLAELGAAYDLLDEHSADVMEESLFRPIQSAYGRAQRTHAGFAERHKLPTRRFVPAGAPPVSHGARTLIDDAVDAVADAEDALAELQDSMLPVEVGDAELRAGLAAVRETLGVVPDHARELTRRLGR